jgi:hypothetical protein
VVGHEAATIQARPTTPARGSQPVPSVLLDRRPPEAPRLVANGTRPPIAGTPPTAQAPYAGSPFSSPVRSMLELSAATRAVAAEPQLAGALAALRREACALTRSTSASIVIFEGKQRAARTTDGPITSSEFLEIVTRVAQRGRREVFDNALVEPIGSAPARAVLALWRPQSAPFEPNDIALVAALVGGITATLHRLLGPR